jgi:dipeptidyl aminopeptidase/acylaminoacyl peptidase
MAKRRAMTPDDFWRLRLLTEMRLSPDGRRVAYTLETADREQNERRSAIWLLDIESGASRQLTSGTSRDHSPRWSPDGYQLAFLSTRGGDETQIWVMPVDGGEPRRLTNLRHGASELFWSADGNWIGFEVGVRPDEPISAPRGQTAEERERARKDEEERPRVISRQIYRWDGKGYLDGRTHLFRVPLDGGEPEQLTEGDYDDGEGACSPDGRYLAFISDRGDERDANMTNDLWLLDLETRELRRLTQSTRHLEHLAWSPDGTRLAMVGQPAVREHAYYNSALLAADIASGRIVNLLEGTDVSAGSGIYDDLPGPAPSAPQWSEDGAWLYFTAQQRGGDAVLRVPAAGGPVETVVPGDEHRIAAMALAPEGGQLFALRSDPSALWDLWAYSVEDGAAAKAGGRLTEQNAALLEESQLAIPERFRVPSEDGLGIDAWLYRPVGIAPDAKAPLVLWIHGGPHSAYGQSWYLQAHILAGKGYAVLHANPRGSSGYGEAFGQACDADWGGGDYRDLMAVVDAAIARGGIDAERLVVMGTSYGGYMTNWIVTQTERFRAAVTINSVTDLRSSFGVGDMDAAWASGDYGGYPWERDDYYRERSPLTHAPKVTTPIRIISAENDYRCPISESEEWYTWLKQLGRAPVDFVRLPKATHSSFASPRQRIRRMELVLEWIERYCPA